MYKKAEAGIGTLILFIALILVAAVAAGVLIQTSSSLQSKALATGSKAQTQVSTQIQFNSVWGEDGSDGSIEVIYAELKLAPGSDPVKLNDTLIEFVLNDAASNLANNGTHGQCSAATVGALTDPSNLTFATEYVVQGNYYRADYFQSGDVILICFASPRVMNEDEEFRMMIIPKTGGLSQIEGSTPDVMATYKIDLFP
ncbi:MAG TPA: archaellin/type IV pilin N-terminal domain-containing protein [Acidobacteriota bacterium]|nr:archaellin/type IV pilin N-terminal domain-containing protein [Acidobacteriota bacterium]